MTDLDTAAQAVHNALAEYLEDGEIAVHWALVIDVAGPDSERYLAHRSGGGHDGTSQPMPWAALGMLRSSCQDVERALRDSTVDVYDDDEDEAA